MGSKKSKSTTTVKLDPQTQQLNEMRLLQERALEPIRNKAFAEMGKIFDPTNSLPTGMSIPAYRTSDGQEIPGTLSNDLYSKFPGLADLKFASPEEAFGASRAAALTDVSGLRGAAGETLDKVIAPQLLSAAIAQGMGRSGAGLEAIQKAGMQFALPIEQARMGAEQNLANFVTGLGQRRQNFAASLSSPGTFAPLTGAPTTTTKTSQPSNIFGSILGGVGSILGGPVGGMIGSGIGSIFGGGGGASSGGGGGTNWNIPQMSAQYHF